MCLCGSGMFYFFFLLFLLISPEFLLVASGRYHLHFRGPRTVDSDFGARERQYYLMKNRHCAFMGFSCARCGWRQYRRYCLGCSFPFLRAPISLCRYCSFVCAALSRFNRSPLACAFLFVRFHCFHWIELNSQLVSGHGSPRVYT